MTTTTPESRAQIAYTAYGRKVGFRSFTGAPLPMFGELPPGVRGGWMAAAASVWDPARDPAGVARLASPEGRAAVAYTAYAEAVGGQAVNGDQMPSEFVQLDLPRQEAWIAAATALYELAVTGRTTIS